MELNRLLENADIITNHVPLEKSGKYNTLDLLNGENLCTIKENSLLVHLSRGGVINEDALLKIVKEKNCTLIIDVYKDEPHPNLELVKIAEFATAHTAGYSLNGKLNGSKMVLEAYKMFSKKEIDINIIEQELKNEENSLNLYSDISLLFKKLCHYRAIEADSSLYKERILNSQAPEKEFDLLRKNYPKRKEFLKII